MKSLYTADIRDNQLIDGLFLVAAKNHGVTKGGNSYLTLRLLDRSGEIEARVWDRADDLGRGFDKNDFVRVRGQAMLYQGKMQIRVQDVIRVDESKVASEDFLPNSAFDPDAIAETPYDPTDYQKTLFVAQSFDDLCARTAQYLLR